MDSKLRCIVIAVSGVLAVAAFGTANAANTTPPSSTSAACSSDTVLAGWRSPVRTVPAGCSRMTFRLRGGTLFTQPPTFPRNPLAPWKYQIGDLVQGEVTVQAGDTITLKPVDSERGPGTFALIVAGREVAVAAGGGSNVTSHVAAGVTLISITLGRTVVGAEPRIGAGLVATFK